MRDKKAALKEVTESLFARMQHIAKAYQLHVLPRLDFYGCNSLTRDQVESLLDEIEFIARVVDDAALRPQLERLRDVALLRSRGTRSGPSW